MGELDGLLQAGFSHSPPRRERRLWACHRALPGCPEAAADQLDSGGVPAPTDFTAAKNNELGWIGLATSYKMNSHESRHFCCLSIFEQVLRSVPDWEVVITSTWRLQIPLESLRDRFSPDVALRIIGVTTPFSHLQSVPDSLKAFEREGRMQRLAARQ